jgi:P-type conjugative transfer protein TrbJ
MKAINVVVLMSVLTFGVSSPARAQWVVLDPANLVQNTLTALRTLNEINNQVRQLENEANMLSNESKNLSPLNFSVLSHLVTTLATTNRLLAQTQGLAFDLQRAQGQFSQGYPIQYTGVTNNAQLQQAAQLRASNSLEALRTTVNMQSQSQQNFASDQANLTDLVNHSQGSAGALEAIQSTNQLLALNARQAIQAQQLTVAQDRATALEQARTVAAEQRAFKVRQLFTTGSALYTPRPVSGFGP